MVTQHIRYFTRNGASLLCLLAVVALVLAACGGAGGGGSGGDNQQPENAEEAGQEEAEGILGSAVDKGAIEYGQTVEDEITSADDQHSYQFTGSSGDQIVISINATGSAFTSPYFFLHGPDEVLLTNSDTRTRSRSARVRHTLEADGTYTIIVQPQDDVGIAGYQLALNVEQSEQAEATEEADAAEEAEATVEATPTQEVGE